MKKLASALAALAMTTSAMAVTTIDLGTAPGSFNLASGGDTTYMFELGPGDYNAVLKLNTEFSTFAKVWFSKSADFNFGDPDDLGVSLRVGDTRARRKVDRSISSTETYYLHVDWTEPLLRGMSPNAFTGTLSVTTAVPEPATGAMLLAGLGALGLAARRRRQGS